MAEEGAVAVHPSLWRGEETTAKAVTDGGPSYCHGFPVSYQISQLFPESCVRRWRLLLDAITGPRRNIPQQLVGY